MKLLRKLWKKCEEFLAEKISDMVRLFESDAVIFVVWAFTRTLVLLWICWPFLPVAYYFVKMWLNMGAFPGQYELWEAFEFAKIKLLARASFWATSLGISVFFTARYEMDAEGKDEKDPSIMAMLFCVLLFAIIQYNVGA